MEVVKLLDARLRYSVLSDLVSGLAEIALTQAEDGQVEAARATIGRALEAAESMAESMGDVPAHALIKIATAQLEAGLDGNAKSTLRNALRDLKSQGERYLNGPSPHLASILEVLLKMHDASLL